MPRHIRIAAALASVSTISLGMATAPAYAQVAADKRSYNIEAQSLGDALSTYAEQSGIEIIFTPDAVRGKRSTAVRGSYTPAEALSRLLRGSGLISRRGSGTTIIVEQRGAGEEVIGSDRLALAGGGLGNGPKAESAPDEQIIVVTGSSIRGQASAGANVQIITREELDRSGYATVHDFMSTVTQNFSGSGASEDFSQGPFRSSNQFFGAGVDLRGLGPDATLSLINGRRMAQSGFGGDFADVSTIPQTAIERIEILTDGASAIYGSDAIGGVVNIILRKDFDGSETRLRYGRAPEGGLDEYRVGQTIGRAWDRGNILATYEYYRRDDLHAADRAYARTLDLRSRGGADYRLPFGNPGNIIDLNTFQAAYAIPAGQDGRNLTADDLLFGEVNYLDWEGAETLLPRVERHSGYLMASHQVSDQVELFGEGRFSQRKFAMIEQALPLISLVPPENPFFVDPSGTGIVFVGTNLSPDLGPNERTGFVRSAEFAGGATVDISRWQWRTYASFTQEQSRIRLPTFNRVAVAEALSDPDPATALNLFGHGRVNNPDTIRKIRDELRWKARSTMTAVNTVLDGSLLSMGSRDLSLAIGAEYRRYGLETELTGIGFPLSRKVYAAFAELYAPLVSPEQGVPLVRALEVSAAIRHDRYSDAGDTTNPKLGIRYTPFSGLQLNATYGTSFRAPNLSELATTNNISFLESAADPRSPSGRSNVLLIFGNDPTTRPETAETWTFGLNLVPPAFPGFSASLHYSTLQFNDRITNIEETRERLLGFEEQYPGIVIRNPDNALLQAICAENGFQGDPLTCTSDFIQVLVDQRSRNVARTKVQSLDAAAAYVFDLGSARLALNGSATFLLEHSSRTSEMAPSVDRAGTYGHPADFRGRGSLSVSRSGLSANVAVNYTDSYRNPVAKIRRKIDSLTTVDLNLGFRFDQLLHSSERGRHALSFNIINLFDTAPPFVDGVRGYDGGNADPLGRFIALELKLGL